MNRDKEVEAALKRPPTEEPIDDESLDDQDPVQHVRPARARTSADLLRPPTVQRLPRSRSSLRARRAAVLATRPGRSRHPIRLPEAARPGRPTDREAAAVGGRLGGRDRGLDRGLPGPCRPRRHKRRGQQFAVACSQPLAWLDRRRLRPAERERGRPFADGHASTPRPVGTFQKYQVVAGDSVAKVATKFHLQKWELLLANPQIVNNVLKLGSIIYIPLPGQLTPSQLQAAPRPATSPRLRWLRPESVREVDVYRGVV